MQNCNVSHAWTRIGQLNSYISLSVFSNRLHPLFFQVIFVIWSAFKEQVRATAQRAERDSREKHCVDLVTGILVGMPIHEFV